MGGRASGILAEPRLRAPVHEEHGPARRLGARRAMRRSHRHDDVELAPAEARAARLEVRAFLERLSPAVAPVASPAGGGPAGGRARWVAVMAAVVAQRFREPLGVAEIAAAQLHPATGAFRAVTGTTPGAFLLRCRLAEARRLLGDGDVDGVGRQAQRSGHPGDGDAP